MNTLILFWMEHLIFWLINCSIFLITISFFKKNRDWSRNTCIEIKKKTCLLQYYICGDEPWKGPRWHCTNYPRGVNFGGPCVIGQIRSETPIHPSEHQLIAIRLPTYSKHRDSDYQPHSFHKSTYNYLDPNFLPKWKKIKFGELGKILKISHFWNFPCIWFWKSKFSGLYLVPHQFR